MFVARDDENRGFRRVGRIGGSRPKKDPAARQHSKKLAKVLVESIF